MGKEETISLELNADDLLKELEEIEQRADEVEELVEEVEARSLETFNRVMTGVHAGWLATQGMVRAAGGTIQTVFRTVVGTTLGAISALTPIFAAQATAGDYVRAALGFASIAAAVSALIAAELEQREFSDAMRGANMALHGIQSLIGVFNW